MQRNLEGSEYARIYDYLRLHSDVTAEPRSIWYSRAPVLWCAKLFLHVLYDSLQSAKFIVP